MFRATIGQIVTATFGVVFLVVILEHAGGFSQILGKSATAYATSVKALEGH